MYDKKIILKGLALGLILSNMPINSIANIVEEYNINKEEYKKLNLKEKKENKIDEIKECIEDFFKNIFNESINKSKEIAKTNINTNIRSGTVLEITLTDGQFIEDLSGNPDGYETVRVITEGNKKLVKEDYDNLRLSGIPKVDLSNAYSESIPAGAFMNGTHLTEFKFPKGLTTIESGLKVGNDYSGAFYNCYNLSGELIIPDTVTKIGDYAFRKCSGFTGNLVIPESVDTIGNGVFYDCINLNGTLTLSERLKTIANNAFYNCSGFTGDLIIPDSVTSLGGSSFYGCSGFNGTLKLSENVTLISSNTFYGCSNLSGSIILPNKVTSIGDNAFRGCSRFSGNLNIHNNIKSIGNFSFYGCNGLNGTLLLSNQLTSIGNNTFSGCSKLTGDLIMPDTITSIGTNAFRECGGFNGTLVLSNQLKSIGNGSFYNCKGFRGELNIPVSVQTIGSNAFEKCAGFSGDLIIPNNVTEVGASAFLGCSGFNGRLVVSDNLVSINDYAFRECSGLNGDLVLSDKVTSVGKYAFYQCKGFDGKLDLGENITTLGERAFRGCNKINGDVLLHNKIQSIGNEVFTDCSSINSIRVAVNESNINSDTIQSIVNVIPSDKLVVELPYGFDTTDTWLETSNTNTVNPILKFEIEEEEYDTPIDTRVDKVNLYLPVLFKEYSLTVFKDGKEYKKYLVDGDKYIFNEVGQYNVSIITELKEYSNLSFIVKNKNIIDIESNIDNLLINSSVKELESMREIVNNLSESIIKDELQSKLNLVVPTDMTSNDKKSSVNLDIYIKPKNNLTLTIDTNSIIFEDFDGVDDMIKENAINLTIESSLPYQVNASLETEIQNSDGTNILDKSILGIKSNDSSNYQTFIAVKTPLTLLDNQDPGKINIHPIDLKINKGVNYAVDVYKTVLKFEVVQK